VVCFVAHVVAWHTPHWLSEVADGHFSDTVEPELAWHLLHMPFIAACAPLNVMEVCTNVAPVQVYVLWQSRQFLLPVP
jgi:hypothetical protein